MADQGTPHRGLEQSSRLSLFSSTPVNNIGTEATHEETNESQALLQQTELQTDALLLETVCQTGAQCFKELVFVVGHTGKDKVATLTITQRELYFHPPFGYVSRVHIVITGNEYTVNVLANKYQSGTLHSDAEVYKLCEIFSVQSSYKFCPGIDWELYEEQYHTVIRYHLKSVRYCLAPFQRVDSVNCQLWLKLPINAPLSKNF